LLTFVSIFLTNLLAEKIDMVNVLMAKPWRTSFPTSLAANDGYQREPQSA